MLNIIHVTTYDPEPCLSHNIVTLASEDTSSLASHCSDLVIMPILNRRRSPRGFELACGEPCQSDSIWRARPPQGKRADKGVTGIGRKLSRTSKLLLRLTTTDSRWRKICKSLVGPWRLHPQVDDKYDWTLDPDCYPQSQFDNNPKSPAYYYPDWYTFTTRFLIPHFDFLGWHVSNISPLGQLILITYDTNNGRLVAQEIKCKNIYSLRTRTRQTTTDPGQPTDNRPTWPTWLPLNSIQIYPNQTEYNLVNGPNRFSFDIFKPVFEFSPFFEIVPIEPHYRLSGLPSDYEHITLQKPELVRRPWNDLGHRFTDTPFFEPTKLIGSRTNILSRSILDNGFDLVTHANQEEETEFCSITLASSSSRTTTDEGEENPATIDHEVANRDEGRIRYQGGRGGTRRAKDLEHLIRGENIHDKPAGTLRPVVDLPIEYYPYNGPFPHTPSKPAGIHGLWVGTYGSHGTEFGHLMSRYDSSSGQNHIYFVKITGDLNIPAGQISWKFACLDLIKSCPFRSIMLFLEILVIRSMMKMMAIG
ncbi:hypothetical protein PSHT_13342 [Puccinia striiformis]|uniref:Uncharacterized protein n=1 Tax=Puccinia striiformis TaxID=27350 RepID=A0A2S4URK1_9BASI|nr:hypothetical protein PSHT_13342 [Puccinia striiformis]